MENRKSKVFVSILLIVLCLSVCVGLTYAYFTDSAKSSGNKIQAGNLKLDLKLYDKVDDEWISIKNTEDPVFNYDKWEPGYVDAKLLKIENLGDLAMQWEAKLVSTEAVSAFANAIEVYVQKSDTEITYPADRAAALAWTKVGTLDQFINTAEKLANGTFTAQGEAYYIGIAFYMPAEITDNTLQGQVLGAFDIQINATQLPYESDAFDESYDADATLPNGGVTPPEDTSSESAEPGEPGDSEIFTWERNAGGSSYTVTGLVNPGTVENVVIPATYNGLPVTAIGDNAFNQYNHNMACTITSVVIPDSVTVIGNNAFSDCGTLERITLGNNVTNIGDMAFSYCSALTEITLPDSVVSIGDSAFVRCTGLEKINIPNNVITIGVSAFYDCLALAYDEYENACYLGNDTNKYVALVMANSPSIGSCDINENTKIICGGAFNGCTALTSITIPASVTTITGNPFQMCSGLTSIDVNRDNAAYQSIDGNLYSKDGTVLVAYAYGKGQTDTSFTIPDGVTTIGDSAFSGCAGLTSVEIPNSVTTIGDSAFSGCAGLTSVEIPNSVTAIGYSAFRDCTGLTSIEIPNSVTAIGSYAFSGCTGLTGITIPDGVTTIGEYAFVRCSGLTSITIPNGVTTIGRYVFSNCTGLTSVTIPNSVVSIEEAAFMLCTGLTSITIPDSVTTIGNSAFFFCSGLKSITFDGTTEKWEAITFVPGWNLGVPATEVVCSDGNVALN